MKIQRPFIAQALQRLFRLTGRIQLEFEPFLIGTVQLADLGLASMPPVCRSAMVQFTVPAVVGEVAIWRMEAPGSVIARLTSVYVRMETTESNLVARLSSSFAVPPTTQAPSIFTDGRLTSGLGVPPLPAELPAVAVLSDTQVAGLAGINYIRRVDTGLGSTFSPPNWLFGTGDPIQFGFIEFLVNRPNEAVEVVLQWDEFQDA